MKTCKVIIGLLTIVIFILGYGLSQKKPGEVYLGKKTIRIVKEYTPAIITKKKFETNTVQKKIPYPVILHPKTKVDTNEIIRQYLMAIAYADTLMDNDTAFILVKDTVQANRIKSRQKIITIHPIIIHRPERGLYAGAGLGGSQNQFLFSAGLRYQDLHNRLWGIQYYPLQRAIELNLYFRIAHWK